jgi:hypothetical protein
MNTMISKSILGGVIGTAIMTVVIFVTPMIGIPKMSPPDMLAVMLGIPIMAGWIMHFMIGITFALAYTYLFASKVKIGNIYLKGAVFGFAVFIFAQIALAIMETMLPAQQMEGSTMLLMIGSIMAHIVFGIAVSKTVGHALCIEKSGSES